MAFTMIRYHCVFIKSFLYYQESILQLDEDNILIFNNTWKYIILLLSYLCLYVCVRVCVFVCERVWVCVCVCVCIFLCISLCHFTSKTFSCQEWCPKQTLGVNYVMLWKLLWSLCRFPSSPFLVLSCFTCKDKLPAWHHSGREIIWYITLAKMNEIIYLI